MDNIANPSNLKKEFIKYIVPSVAAQIVFTVYVMIDAIFVARGVGAKALAGVNIAGPLLTLLFAISITAAVGTSTQVARLKGEGNWQKAAGIFSLNFVAVTGISVFIGAGIFFGADTVSQILGATANTKVYVVEYIKTIAPFTVFFIYSYLFEIMVATDGFPAKATKVVTVGVIANLVMDYLFIFIFKWGVFGAAFATGASQLIVTVIYLFHFIGPKGSIKFTRFKFSIKEIGGSFYKGLPSGLMEVSPGVITFIMIHFISYNIGEEGLIAFSAMAYMAGIMIVIAIGVGQGAQPLISFQNGRGNRVAIKKLLKYQIVTSVGIELVVFIGVCILSVPFVSTFLSSDAWELIDYTSEMIRFYLSFAIVEGFVVVSAITMTGLEKPLMAMVQIVPRCTVFLIVGGLIGTIIGGNSIWFAMLIAEILTLFVSVTIICKEFAGKY